MEEGGRRVRGFCAFVCKVFFRNGFCVFFALSFLFVFIAKSCVFLQGFCVFCKVFLFVCFFAMFLFFSFAKFFFWQVVLYFFAWTF